MKYNDIAYNMRFYCCIFLLINIKEKERKMSKKIKKSERGITLIALVITTIFSYDENVKSSNNKGFLLQTI